MVPPPYPVYNIRLASDVIQLETGVHRNFDQLYKSLKLLGNEVPAFVQSALGASTQARADQTLWSIIGYRLNGQFC